MKTFIHDIMRHLCLCGAIVLFLVIGLGFTQSKAQESIQISIVNVPPVLPSPFISDLENNVLGGNYQLHLNYLAGHTNPIELEFEIRLYRNRELLVDEVSESATFQPGFHNLTPIFDNIRIRRSPEQVIADLGSSMERQILQAGALPEGDYTIEVNANLVDDRTNVHINGGRANFTVTHPQPPRLLSPVAGSNITMDNPLFSWTPVMGPGEASMEYEFLLVEVFDSQSPEEAIDANRPHHHQVLNELTSVVYTNNFYPLEAGREYAWQIRARDIGVQSPIRNNGESEIQSFVYKDFSVDPGDIADLEEIPLIHGIASVTNLERVEWTDTGSFYELNGPAEVTLQMNYLPEPVVVRADLIGLTIQKTGLTNPVITGGRVDMPVHPEAGKLITGLDWINVSNLSYHFGRGVTGRAEIDHEEFGRISTAGHINLTHAGPEGTLTAETEDLLRFEDELISVSVNRIKAVLHQQSVYADASVSFLGEPSPCEINGLNLNSEQIRANWTCTDLAPAAIGSESGPVQFETGRVSGSLTLFPETRQLEYSLITRGELTLGFQNSEPCGVRLRGTFSHDNPADFAVLGNTCTVPEPQLDLGFARLGLQNIEIDSFGYNPSGGGWDFDIPFEASVYFPLFADWELDHEQEFRLTPEGIEIPGFSEEDDLPEYEHDGLNIAMSSISMDGFTYPFSDWSLNTPGSWNLTFDAEATIGESQGLPSCLRSAKLKVEDGEVIDGILSADLALATLTECRAEFFPGHRVSVSALGGTITAGYHPDSEEVFSTLSETFIEGYYEPGNPISCPDGSNPSTPTTANLSFSGGHLIGELSVGNPGCDIPVGPMTAGLNEATLYLDTDESGQQAEIAANATLQFSQNSSVQGSLVYNVIQNSFSELSFQLDEPFIWEIPSENPVFSFHIGQAAIDTEGLFIDGRQEVHIGDTEIGVTFDNLLLDLYDRSVISGQVFFDEHFALSVDFSQGLDAPVFSALPVSGDEEITLPEEGLYMELGADVSIDSTGIRTSGVADGHVAIGEFEFDELSVEFTDDFAFSLSPFRVSSGRVDFYYSDTRIAYLDGSGLNPLISGFAEEILPDKLPMPTTQVAYLKLRDDQGELVIDFEEPEPGLIELKTLPDTPVDMVVPVLDPDDPPVIGGVEFEDFVITATPGNFQVDTGSAKITLGDGHPLSDLAIQAGIPFELSEIRFGETDFLADPGNYLQLAGNLNLFGHPVTSEANTFLRVSGGGIITGDFDLPDLNTDIPMLPNTDHLQLGFRSLAGSLTLPALGDGELAYNLDIETDFKLGSGVEANALSELDLNIQPGSITIDGMDALEPEFPVRVDLPGFAMNLNAITSIPFFEYTSTDGWDFVLNLDADFEFGFADDPFTLPINGLQLGTDGFAIPEQHINESTLAGLELPVFELAGFNFKPLALRTNDPIAFNWFDGQLPDVSPLFDFELRLPDIADGALEPVDGFTFTDVSFSDGLFTGAMQPYNPIDGLVIPAGPAGLNPPELRIDEIFGALEPLEIDGELTQHVDLSVSGSIEEIPFFNVPDPDCSAEVTYTLDIIAGQGFSGDVSGLTPCGSAEVGPLTLTADSGTLTFAYEEGSQAAVFSGSMTAELEAPQGTIAADGIVGIDLIEGRITDGEISVDDPFMLGLPATADDPFMEFEVQHALLNSDGFLIDAAGELQAGDVGVGVIFNQFLLGLPDFEIHSGEAQIAAGFGLHLGLSPFAASITSDDDETPPATDGLIISAESAVTVDSTGLSYEGVAGAALRIADEDFANLRTEFEEDFTFRLNDPSVESGRALFYYDVDGPAEDPIAIYDTDGFHFGQGIIAALPDTLGLPISDIAYAVIKDEAGEPVVNIEANDGGGYLLETGDDPVQIHFPALASAGGNQPEVEAHFSLTTDDQYKPNGGFVTINTAVDLEPYLGVPLAIDSLGISADGETTLTSIISLELPAAFGDQKATAQAIIGSNGLAEAEFEIGNYSETYDSTLDYILEQEVISTLSGDDQDSEFIVGLYGAQLTFNSPASLMISGAVETSVMQNQQDENFSVFYTAGYDDGWQFQVESSGIPPTVNMGMAELSFDEYEPFSVTADENEFIIEVSGTISFEDVIGESLSFAVQDLMIGATDFQSDPELAFGLGSATLALSDEQEFEFFEGALSGSFSNPALTISGRTFTASVDSGELTFFEEQMQFENLSVDTQGNFIIGSISSDEVEILQEYLVLKSLGVSRDQDTGMSLSSNFGFMVPEPIDRSGELLVSISRSDDNSVNVETEISQDSDFDPGEELEIELGSSITVSLTDALIDINPMDVTQTEIAVAAKVGFMGEDRITLGEAGNMSETPGISVRMGRDPIVKYNVTGNVAFSFDHSFFHITIDGDVASSNEELFEITLNGEAGLDISGVAGSAGFKDMVINSQGIDQIGNFDGNAKFDLMDIATLELGTFVYEQDDDGIPLTLAGGFDSGPEDLGDGEETTEEIEVVEFLCFGPCPEADAPGDNSALYLSLGGESNSSNGAFSGGIEQILFYETTDGDITFNLDNFEVELGDMFEAYASLRFQSGQDGMALLAVGGGSFEVGESQAAAMIAGSFSTMGDELSFGVFAAVSADIGLEVVPGVVSIAGFGGGFFYNPDPDDLDIVLAAVDNFRPDPPGDMQRGSPQRPADEDAIKFSVMLYAELELIGAGGASLLAGSTFMEITNQYFYMDADGVIMELDGETGPGLLAGAAMSAQVGRDPHNPEAITMHVSLQAVVELPPMIEGNTTGDGIEFMLTKTQDEVVWGIMGGVELTMYGGLVNGSADLLASKDGFLFELDLSAGLDPPVITVSAEIGGAMWYLRYEGAELPLGAYVEADAEISIPLISVSANMKGAFVRRGTSQYELFAMGRGCGRVGKEVCVEGWFQLKTNPLRVDGGKGPGEHANLIPEAQAQRDEFEALVNEAMGNLEAAMESPPPPPGVNLEDQLLAEAGYNFLTAHNFVRNVWHFHMVQNEERAGNDIPNVLADLDIFEDFGALISAIIGGSYWSEDQLDDNEPTSWTEARNQAEAKLDLVEQIAGDVIQQLDASVIKAIEYEAQTADAREDMMAVMASSPVQNVVKPVGGMSAENLPHFEIDEDEAANQVAAAQNVMDTLDELDQQIHAVVDSIEHNLTEMDQLLGLSDLSDITELTDGSAANPTFNSVSQLYAEALETIDYYYAVEANRYWHRIRTAEMVRNMVNVARPNLESATSILHNRLVSAYNNRASDPSTYETEREMAAERVRILESLAEDALNPGSPYVFNGYPLAQQAYDDLGDVQTVDFSNYEENIQNLWIDMHVLGNEQYMQQKAQYINNEFRTGYLTFRHSLIEVMQINTGLLNDFYDLKAGMLMNLYHIIDNYIEIRSEVLEGEQDDILSDYLNKRQDILTLLEPPQLTQVNVDTEHLDDHFFGSAEITWDAVHPVGIAEASIDIKEYEQSTDVTVGSDDYITIGKPAGFTYTAYKDNYNPMDVLSSENWYDTKQINVGIRLRSKGGITSTQRVNFDMQVGDNGIATQPGDDLLPDPDDTLPPEALYVNLEYYYDEGQLEQAYFVPDGMGGFTYVQNEKDVFWTDNPDFINIRALVKEHQTNIKRFEYAIGSSSGGDDVVAWTELVGPIGDYTQYGGYFTDYIDAQSRILSMEAGNHYYVSVRAVNMHDQERTTHNNKPVVYDATPPTAPGPPDTQTFIATYSFQSGDPVPEEFVNNPPQYALSTGSQQVATYYTEEIPSLGTIRWSPSVDEQSGVSHYEYVVTTDEHYTDGLFASEGYTTTDTEVTITSGQDEHSGISFDFDDLMYVHIRAVNNAGLASETYTVGPRYPHDPNAPSKPVAVGYSANDHIRIYMTERSYDAESGIRGHQYSVGTSPGAVDIRGWPDTENMDHDDTSILYSPPEAPYIEVPKEELPIGQELYFNIRGVNNQGMLSSVASTGPVIFDDTPPEVPQISISTKSGNVLELDIDNLLDPVSGISGVDVRLVRFMDSGSSYALTQWHTITSHSGVRKGSFSESRSYTIDEDVPLSEVRVYVRATNGAGKRVTVSEQVPSSYLKYSPVLDQPVNLIGIY